MNSLGERFIWGTGKLTKTMDRFLNNYLQRFDVTCVTKI